MVIEDVEDKGIADDKGKQATDEQKAEYDKQQQMIDQERANAKRARARADEADKNNAALREQLAETKEQINQLTGKIDELNRPTKIDPNEVDVPEVAQYAQALEAEIADLKRQQAFLKKQQDDLKAKEAEALQQSEVQRMQEQILTDCDDEFGAKYRNEALKMADELVASGEEKLPSSQYEGSKLMRKCYAEIAKKTAEKKNTTPTDSGSGTVAVSKPAGKPGSMQEVLDDMKKNPKSWRARAG